MSNKPLPIDQIRKLAEDVRLIKDFAENHNFDASLINAAVTPTGSSGRSLDWPLMATFFFVVVLLGSIAVLNFWEPLSSAATKFVFTFGLLSAVFASISIHKKFENTTITVITCAGLVVVLLIASRRAFARLWSAGYRHVGRQRKEGNSE
jgi:lysylphosphatidylglycerol synthetase-like protein (DUF2156 family)